LLLLSLSASSFPPTFAWPYPNNSLRRHSSDPAPMHVHTLQWYLEDHNPRKIY
jgi:hypothetical protein